jgi:hypothetical protein
MRFMSSRLAALAAVCLSSTGVMAAGTTMIASSATSPVISQADQIIVQNGFTPVGQPMQKGSVIGSLARLGNQAFIVTIDAQTGQFLDAKPTAMALPAMAPVPMSVAAPVAVVHVTAAPVARVRPHRLPARYMPTYRGRRGNPAQAVASSRPHRPVLRRLPNVSLASLPRPSGFNRVLGPVYNGPGVGYFVIDPTLGPVALDPSLFGAALAISQGLLDPSVIGPGYSANSGYQLGYRDGLNDATIGSLQQPLFVDPTQGPVFVNPATGQPVVYGPSTTPGMPPQALPYVDPAQQQAFSDFANTIVNSATPTVTPAAADAAAQRLNVIPGLGTGQPLTDQQLGDVAIAIGEATPPGGFTAEQKQNLQTIADHLTPDAGTAGPAQTQTLQQDIGTALGSDTPAVSAADQQAAQERVAANPAIGSGHPIGGQQLDDIATAMGVPTPPGGFSTEQRQNLEQIASSLTPADPQTLQNTAVDQAVEADPDKVYAKVLSDLGMKDPSALDPNAVAAVAASQPGAVDPVALNDVVEANPQDVQPDVLRQAAMDNPGSITPQTLSDVAQTDPSFNPSGITPAADDVQQQVEANLNAAAQTIGQPAEQQPFMTFDSTGTTGAPPASDATQATDGNASPANRQPFMTFDSANPAAASAAAPATESTQPADANAATNGSDSTFNAQDFSQPGAADTTTPAPTPTAPGDAAAGQVNGDSTFSAGDFNQPATADANAPATTETTTPAAAPAPDNAADGTDQTFSAQDFNTPSATSPDTTAGDQTTTDSNAPTTDATAPADAASSSDAAPMDTAPAADAPAPADTGRPHRNQNDNVVPDTGNNDQTMDNGDGSDMQQDSPSDNSQMDNGANDNTQMDNSNDNSGDSGNGEDSGDGGDN